ncbi:MAG: hypothetical protein ACFB4I_19685 [Cyanophyceae cyanobacterium]
MRSLVVGAAVVLSLLAPAYAGAPTESVASSSPSEIRRTEAFNLVSSAYRGELEEQGIPGYLELTSEYELGTVEAEDIVQAAVEAGVLSPKALEDKAYLEAVEIQLESLTTQE